MNEKQKEEHLSTADLAVVTEKEQHNSEDRPIQDERKVEKSVESRVETDTKAIALLPDQEIDDFQSRWNAIQTGFVDEPRTACRKCRRPRC